MPWKAFTIGLAGAAIAIAVDFSGPFSGELDHPAIEYATRPEHNAIAELNRRIQDGKVRLTFDGTPGYLRSTLEALRVPVESQLVVFSKTSLQQGLISATNPRTLFFSDSVAVGWVPGEPFVEVAAQDSEQGVIFYTVDQRPVEKPVFIRQNRCLVCHEDYATLGVPGMLVRSVFPAPDGTPLRPLGEFVSDQRSPFAERWGGWFLTGDWGKIATMANRSYTDSGRSKDIALFDASRYLSPYSDIVARLVFDHQMRMINLLTRAAWEARFAAQERSNDLAAVMREAAREVVDYMLFVDEAALPGAVHGTSGFSQKFSAIGPQDSKGRSLRQFDLSKRVMRYPCSYMIYSEAFEALPPELKEAIYRRMWQILSGEEKTAKYGRLLAADRQAIIGILRETKKDLPEYFRM